MIKGLFEAHLPVSNLEDSIVFYEKLGLKLESIIPNKVAFLWIIENKSWLGLWETDVTKYPYHPSIRHVAFEVSLENLKQSISWLKDRQISTREAFGFEGKEPFVSPHEDKAYAKIHFYDLDKNSLEFITELKNPNRELKKMYISEWLENN
ncbi:VOC family protein [Mammaliicoccus fleurettii]|uniref:VOC family protein n=1 Tax=Mammaliicoccus fleurettii TaxID=150056 RepID=UPI000991E9DE|nr:VOC family protein [Mammaliicoccus fleurettii]OOV77254.1 glutathione transferase [Mammaliicoccus fleurettii]